MNLRELFEALDWSRLIRFDSERGLIYAWNGAHTVNVYALYLMPSGGTLPPPDDPAEIFSMFSLEGDDRDHVSEDRAAEAIRERLEGVTPLDHL